MANDFGARYEEVDTTITKYRPDETGTGFNATYLALAATDTLQKKTALRHLVWV